MALATGKSYKENQEIVVENLNQWETQLAQSVNEINNMLKMEQEKESTPIHQIRNPLRTVGEKVNKTLDSVRIIKDNLEGLSQLFAARKGSIEATNEIVKAWPPRRVSERLLWIGYAMIPAGGIQMAFIEEPYTAIAFWLVGAYIIGFALMDMQRYDNMKFYYFLNEMGITGKQLRRPKGLRMLFTPSALGNSQENPPQNVG